MVDDILADKDNSRRKMFEQAAGISKYKVRKRETLNKLKHTSEDLDRVEDLLFEINNNLKSLEKQAKRARKYFELKEKYKSYSTELAILKIGSLKQQQEELKEFQAYYKGLQQQPAPEPEEEPETWDDDFITAAPEPEPEPEPKAPRIRALVFGKGSTLEMSEADYQAWFEQRQQRIAEQERRRAELERERAAARAEAEAQAAAEAAAIAQLPAWVVEFAAQYKLRRLDEITLLQNWIALVLQVAHNRGDTFPVKPIWREVAQTHGAAAPDDRFTSYMFFFRLNKALAAAGIITPGQRRQAARLNVDNWPGWAM